MASQKRLLKPVCLALHAVHQDAPDLNTVDPPPLEYVSRPAPAPLLRICWRKDFVPFAADRLQSLAATERGVLSDGAGQ
jgi:hypothetical protein